MPPIFQEHPQQLLLGFGELHSPAVPAEAHLFKVKGKGANGQDLGGFRGASAELGIHPSPEYRQREGLGDVVVRPGLQPGDLVQLQIVGGEQNHRSGVALRAHLTQQSKAAAVREIHIQNQQVKSIFRQHFPGLCQVWAAKDGCLRPCQGHSDPPPQGLIVL